jgi:hypothetical protein
MPCARRRSATTGIFPFTCVRAVWLVMRVNHQGLVLTYYVAAFVAQRFNKYLHNAPSEYNVCPLCESAQMTNRYTMGGQDAVMIPQASTVVAAAGTHYRVLFPNSRTLWSPPGGLAAQPGLKQSDGMHARLCEFGGLLYFRPEFMLRPRAAGF